MARSFTLSALRLRAQQRCDAENDGHISNSEWNGLISTAYAELYSILADSGLRYFESTETLTTQSTALPSGHLSTLRVEFVVDAAGNRRRLRELMPGQEIAYRGVGASEPRAFAVEGANLVLYPAPVSGQQCIHTYLPQPTDYSSSSDGTSIDVVTPDGEAFIVWHVAVAALAKEEADVQVAMAERERARQRVEKWASRRLLESYRSRDVPDDGDGGDCDEASRRFR